jgi:hypothetical protein
MMKSVALLLLGVAGVQAQTACTSDANGDGEVGVDGASPLKYPRWLLESWVPARPYVRW